MSSHPIAIVGLSGRYPGGATSPDRLWKLLRDGTDAISEAKGDRWDLGYHDPDPEQAARVYTRAGGFLDRIDAFDAEFFGMSPREARQADPQQRLLLELAWEALEDASLVPKQIAGSTTGVFVGISSHDYADLVGPGAPDAYSNTGSSLSIAANRISYVLDLRGPSLAIDTACSSGLVCVHQACRALIEGACDMALVGAANILAHARPWLGFAQASMLSPTGRCKSFDASGDGYVRSEGGGMVVIKKLSDAERDGNTIYGVIMGTGVNSDGRTMGLSMPSQVAQERLLRKVYGDAGVAPEDVFYVEAHGTGTAVGDPIECEAIGRVLGEPRTDGSPCRIGSVKSNIGHLEPASGIAGLTKVLLALRHREIPGNLHFQTPNPRIDFEGWKLDVVTAATKLPDQEKLLVFGVNSFGFGGTNAHAIVREYRAPMAAAAAAPAKPWAGVLVLSAQSEPALAEMARTQAAWLRTQEESAWLDICATAALCRSRLGYRVAVAAGSCLEAAERLERFGAGEATQGVVAGRGAAEPARVAFVYSGNGPQWWAMGRELLAACPAFRAEVEAVDALFEPKTGWSLVEELHRPEEQSRMAQTEVAQPTLFALQLGLTAVLREAGVTPAAVLGHSVGEVAAAHVAGALDRAQATEVIFQRSAMQARTAGTGRMAAIGIGADEAITTMAECGGWLELAARNAPRAVTVAGDPAALEILRERLTDAGKFARILPLNYAFHSRAMDPIEGGLLAALDTLRPSETHTPFISTVDGQELPGRTLDATYWWRNIRERVQFADAVEHVLGPLGITTFVEIGPHPVLRDYVLQCAKARDIAAVAIATLRRPGPNRPEPEMPALWTAIASCHASDVVRPELVFTRPARPAALPTYPWQRQRHWRGWVPLPDVPPPTHRDHPLLGWRPRGIDALWQNSMDLGLLPYLTDHVVQGSVLFPAAGYIELGLAAAEKLFGEGSLEIETFDILRPFVVTARPIGAIETAVDGKDGTIEIRSRPDMFSESWTTHNRARITRGAGAPPPPVDLAAIKQGLTERVDGSAHYLDSLQRGLAYGAAFQGIQSILLSAVGDEPPTGVAEIELPQLDDAALAGYRAHPAVLDSCIQVLIAVLGRTELRQCAFIPVQIERLRSFAPLTARVTCLVTVTRETSRSGSAEFRIYDEGGALLLSIHGARFRKVDFQANAHANYVTEGWRVDRAVAGSETMALPTPEFVAASLATELAAPSPVGSDASAAIDDLIGAYACRALRELGAADGPFLLPQLQRRARVLPAQAGLLARLVEMAEADGALTQEGGRWTWVASHVDRDPAALWRSLMLAHPSHSAELLLAGRHGEKLVTTLCVAPSEIAADKADAATDLLHDGSPTAAAATRIVGSVVAKLLAQSRQGGDGGLLLRVLELGNGGGGLTAAMLPILTSARAEYVLAHRSETVLDRAKQRFSAHHGFGTALFDLDAESPVDDLPSDGFDLVLMAAHLPAGPSALLDRVATLLAPGGWLVAVEPTGGRLEALLPGGSEDHRSLHLVSDEADDIDPQTVLREAGFDSVARLSGAAGLPAAPRSVLLAQRASTPAMPLERGSAVVSSWLLLSGADALEAGFAKDVASRLRSRGHSVQVLTLGSLAGAAFATAADMEPARAIGAQNIVHLAGLAPVRPSDMLEQQDLRCLSTLSLVQAIKSAEDVYKPRLHLVTRGAFAGPGLVGPLDPGQAPLWGLGRVLSNEHPDLAPHLIDLCADLDADAAALLTDELLRSDEEMEVRIGAGQRFVNRMQPMTVAQLSADAASRPKTTGPFRLDVGPQGGIDSLFLHAVSPAAPKPGQVEIRIHAAGLNYRDVLWTMGMLPEEAVEHGFSGATIGMECAGEVSAVGEGVDHLAVGDRVVAFASSTFASHVVTDAGAVARLPADIGYAEAATIPTAFLTAYYALDQLARLRAGESVLIHGAAGGVGLAAVQIAQLRGAVVFGSAGSDEKRRVLQRMGVDHMLNSRSLDFADDIMRLTGGRGVDVVLNSLAGDAINKNLQILRPFGRFLEIGKRDFYANSRIGLRPFRNNLSYFGIDVDTLLIERKELAESLFAEVMALFGTGALRPLPFTPIPISALPRRSG